MTVLVTIAGAGALLAWLFFSLWRQAARDAAAIRVELSKAKAQAATTATALGDYATTRDKIEEDTRDKEDEIRATPAGTLLDRANALFPGMQKRSGRDPGSH
ncbi:MAG: hypothetical protein A2Y38_09190 [Spirochaetes bacterium GWB1_59_5]|nr:MAG: hypothetical protein A2Y38_09190 [Spirochaetes bacterium GWB1_59_5]